MNSSLKYIRGIDHLIDKTTRFLDVFSSKFESQQNHQTWLKAIDKVQSFVYERGVKAALKKFVSQRLSWDIINQGYTGASENTERYNPRVAERSKSQLPTGKGDQGLSPFWILVFKS